MLSSTEKEELPPGDPELHHQISKGTKFRFNLGAYQTENQDDPALHVSLFQSCTFTDPELEYLKQII